MYIVDCGKVVNTFREIEESFNKNYKPQGDIQVDFRVDIGNCLLEIDVISAERYIKLGKFIEVDNINSLVSDFIEKLTPITTKEELPRHFRYLLNEEFGYHFRFLSLSNKNGTYRFHIPVSCYIKASSDEIVIENISKYKDSFVQLGVNGRNLCAWSEHLRGLGLTEIVRNSDKLCLKLQDSIKLPNLANYSF